MKTKLPFLIAFVFLLLGNSCSNEIDLTSDWIDVPIVYGLLSKTDSIHYIRIEKAFLDDNRSALDIAQIPDSVYYPNASVEIKKLNSSDAPLVFEKVDAALEGYEREDGVFATSPNYIYKMILPDGESLEAGTDYELTLDRGENFPIVTAQTTIISDIEVTAPKIPDLSTPLNWGDFGWELKIRWRAKAPTAFFDVVMLVHIEEYNVNNPTEPELITLEWLLKKNQLSSGASNNGIISMSMSVPAENFYRFISAKLDSKPGVYRKFKDMDLLIRSGGPEFLEFIQLRQVNFGITSTQVIPEYSNLSTGLGIFSSRNKILLEGYQVTNGTIDSLIDCDWTRDLNFQR